MKTPEEEIARLERRLKRERAARAEAERIAEETLREAYLQRQDLALLERVTRTANQAQHAWGAVLEVLPALCEYTGWPAARARVKVHEVPTAFSEWHLDPRVAREQVEAIIDRHGPTIVAGAVLRKVTWAPQGPSDEEPGGIALALPIVRGDQVGGVIQIVAPVAAPPTPRVLDVLAQVGLQLGRAVERERTQDELRHAHAEQAELLREFGRSNQELEAFAYIASHDLQEPLRSITGFVELLRRRYEGKLDERADEYISFVVDSAARMKALIEDLLRYSRVGRAELERQSVDLSELLEATRGTVAGRLAETGGVLEVANLPTVEADPGQLGQLFDNLVGNALKFRSDAAPHVRVSAERDGDAWCVTVEDNGIGIPPAQAEAVFELFGRLHPRDEVPGTGIGLAICQKIVERHGGTITVVPGTPGGSRFVLTLPDVRQEQSQ